MKKLLFVVNSVDFFLSHRLPIALAAVECGYDVSVAAAASGSAKELEKHGLFFHALPLTRSGQNPLRELGVLWCLYRLFKLLKPDIVHLVTIKPVLYGGIAARLVGGIAVVAAVSGLGAVFIARDVAGRARRRIVTFLYRLAFKQDRLAVVFQNPDDRDTLLDEKVLKFEQARLVRGSGVNLADFPFTPEPGGIPVVTMAARLLKDKGVREFVAAAKLLRASGAWRFWLIGAPDPGNPATISEAELERWRKEGIVELFGQRSDIAALFSKSNIVVLPSYREGLPKVLVEAAACGRAIVTTDVPGCRDAINPGVTGLLVPPRNVQALADAIQSLLQSAEERARMGIAGRKLAEQEFAIENIVNRHLTIYKGLAPDG